MLFTVVVDILFSHMFSDDLMMEKRGNKDKVLMSAISVSLVDA